MRMRGPRRRWRRGPRSAAGRDRRGARPARRPANRHLRCRMVLHARWLEDFAARCGPSVLHASASRRLTTTRMCRAPIAIGSGEEALPAPLEPSLTWTRAMDVALVQFVDELADRRSLPLALLNVREIKVCPDRSRPLQPPRHDGVVCGRSQRPRSSRPSPLSTACPSAPSAPASRFSSWPAPWWPVRQPRGWYRSAHPEAGPPRSLAHRRVPHRGLEYGHAVVDLAHAARRGLDHLLPRSQARGELCSGAMRSCVP
jgi:hypothetical protein